MKATLFLFFYFLISFSVKAHPAIGLVYDGKKTIYYSDLNHIWKLDTKTGLSEIYKEYIHSHKLFLDNKGNLYGEHYWYVESEEQFKNYIWRIDKKGNFQKIRDTQDGENLTFGFVRDDDFNSYTFNKKLNKFQIIKSDSLSSEIWYTSSLKNPSWQYLTKDNDLLFADFPSVYSANKNGLKVLSKDVSAKRFPFNLQDDKHNIYGLWTDKNNTVYVAIYGGRQVKKIEENGKAKRILTSDFLWSPVNGVFDNNGALWLMECKIGGSIRVRKIERNLLDNQASFMFENILIFVTSVLLLFLIIRFILKKKSFSFKFSLFLPR